MERGTMEISISLKQPNVTFTIVPSQGKQRGLLWQVFDESRKAVLSVEISSESNQESQSSDDSDESDDEQQQPEQLLLPAGLIDSID